MFHLLVAYGGWPDGGGSLSNGRVYIKPDDEPDSGFFTRGKLDGSKLSRIPALLVTETGGDGSQFAKVANITSITQDQSNTSIRYAIDSSIRPIANEDLEIYASQLAIGKQTLTHTHWRICDADLFRVLLLHQEKNSIAPKVFSVAAIYQQDAQLVSVMMPFNAEFKAIYLALQSATNAVGLRCVRADDIWEHHAVIQDIATLIAKARVVICDCSGKNANVFYEAGIAHTLGKEVVLITQSKEDIPFDLRHLRYVQYFPNEQGLEALSKAVHARLRTVTGAD